MSSLTEIYLPFPGAKTFDVVISASLSVGSRWDAGAQPNSPSRSTSHQPYKEKKQENFMKILKGAILFIYVNNYILRQGVAEPAFLMAARQQARSFDATMGSQAGINQNFLRSSAKVTGPSNFA